MFLRQTYPAFCLAVSSLLAAIFGGQVEKLRHPLWFSLLLLFTIIFWLGCLQRKASPSLRNTDVSTSSLQCLNSMSDFQKQCTTGFLGSSRVNILHDLNFCHVEFSVVLDSIKNTWVFKSHKFYPIFNKYSTDLQMKPQVLLTGFSIGKSMCPSQPN